MSVRFGVPKPLGIVIARNVVISDTLSCSIMQRRVSEQTWRGEEAEDRERTECEKPVMGVGKGTKGRYAGEIENETRNDG